jgi:hypothetical protein
VTAREIAQAMKGAALHDVPTASDRALLALRDLVDRFLAETDEGCPESMKAMSIGQVRLLNQLHLAVGR